MPCVSEFEHKSTPHPDEPKDVTVTDEEIDALEKQFASLKIEVLQKIYWHQYPNGRLEAIHPKLVRVRKDGTFFMYDDEKLQDSPKPGHTPSPQHTRPRRGDSAGYPIIVDQPGTANDPIIIKDPGNSAQDPIVLDIPQTSAVVPITRAPAASLVPPRATNPIVIVSIPEATENDMEVASQIKVKGADGSKGRGRMRLESTPESDSGSSRASSSPGICSSLFNTPFAVPASPSPVVEDAAFANQISMFIARLGRPPDSYPYENVQSDLPPGTFDVPELGTLPAALPTPDPFVMPAAVGVPAVCPPTISAPSEVPAIDPVHTNQPPTLNEALAEFFESINMYNVPQVQDLLQSDSDLEWSVLSSSSSSCVSPRATIPAPSPQAQIIVEPQLDPLTQMQTSQLDSWKALYGADTCLELPRMKDIPPPSAWESGFDPTVQAFLDQLWASDAAADAIADAAARPVADSYTALPSQGFDPFNFDYRSITG